MSKIYQKISDHHCKSVSCFILALFICVAFPCIVSAGPSTYRYDALDRLTQSVNAGGSVTTYDYDPESNRTHLSVVSGALSAPDAAFSADITDGTSPLKVHFTDQSIAIIESWSWDFGDSQTSVEQNPLHQYTTPGTYTVTLTVANRDAQDTLTKVDYITVTSPEVPMPYITIAHGFSPGEDGIIDYSGNRQVNFRITLTNTGQTAATVDVRVDLVSAGFTLVTPPANCVYNADAQSFESIPVEPGTPVYLDYVAEYNGNKTADGDTIDNSAVITLIRDYYDAASGMDRGGHGALFAVATVTVTTQSMILGTIRDMSSEKIIYNAMITATGGQNTATGTNGTYSLTLNPGVYTVTVSKSGYQTATLSSVIVYNNKATVLDVYMTTPGVLNITTDHIDDGLAGRPQNPKIKVSGGVYPYTYSLVSGALPPGILLDTANGNLFGTPTAGGSFTFTIGVRDKTNAWVEREFTQLIGVPLGFQTPFDLPRGTTGAAYAALIVSSGGTSPYTYVLTNGSLPQGMQLSQTGSIRGVSSDTGQSYFTIAVNDAAGDSAVRDFTIGIDSPLAIDTAALYSGITGRAFNQTLSASGGYGAYVWSVASGNLPAGITFSAGQLSGTPTSTGSGNVTLQVADGAGRSVRKDFFWTVGDPLVLTTRNLPSAVRDHPYAAPLAVSGGVGSLRYTCLSPLPPGLSMATDTGTITGTASIAGLSNVIVHVEDQAAPDHQADEKILTLRVRRLWGDMNGDGKVDVKDAVIDFQVLCGMDTDGPVDLDLVKGGKIGIEDVVEVLRRIVGN